MVCTVNNIIETLYNPEGRFRTLTDLTLEDTQIYDPVFSYGGAIVSFKVWWKNKPYWLKCFLNRSGISDVALRHVSAQVMAMDTPYLVDYQYRGEEMLIFDDLDQCRYIDVVLMERPEGVLLSRFLAEASDRQDIRSIERVMRSFCKLGAWLLGADVVHGFLKPSNVLVSTSGALKLLNYERMQVPSMDTFRDKVNEDNIAVANLALGLKVLAVAPSAFRALNGNSIFRTPVLRSTLLPVFATLADETDCRPMRRIVDLLMSSNYRLRQRRTLMTALDDLAEDLTIIAPERVAEVFGRLQDFRGFRSETMKSSTDLNRYEEVAPLSEAMRAVGLNGFWGYVDSEGREVVPLRYDWADDFREGRAVVRLDDNFALLDKEGTEVLPAVFESMDWFPEYGVVQVAYDGKVGLYDRDGHEILPMYYDWLGPMGPLVLVRREGLCGYIRPNGELAIPLQYEDAYDFDQQGKALVCLQGRSYYIDMEGHELPASDQEPALEEELELV